MLEELESMTFFRDRMEPWVGLAVGNTRLSSGAQAYLRRELEVWLKFFDHHGFVHAKTATEKLVMELPIATGDQLMPRFREIKENFIIDCKQKRIIYIIDADKSDYVDTGFEAEVDTAFPDALVEIREANTCYGLGRNTASVFHFMRAVEHGLRALSTALGVPPANMPLEYQEWQRLFQDADKAWRQIENPQTGWGQSPELTNARAFFKRVMADVDAFKDDVRNVTMHTRTSYDASGALSVRNRVRDWFLVLATKVAQDMAPGSLLDRALFAP